MPKDDKKDQTVAMPLWKDKPISDPSHIHDLEQRAALHEFEHKLPKEAAEAKAHEEYKRLQHVKAAASHFAGMKAAKATGDQEEVRKHHAMYVMHLQHLGHDPMDAVPKEVEHHMGEFKDKPFYRFQPHNADGFLFQDKKKK
jgi:hypothetical protein